MNLKSQTDNAWKTSWVNDFSNNVRLANELNNAYAEDIIQAVQEKDFDTLESALEDLRVRIGVSKTAMQDIEKIAIAGLSTKKASEHGEESCDIKVALEIESEEGIPGNAEGEPRLVKETEASVKSAGAPEHLKEFQFKKKEESAEGEELDKEEEKKNAKAAFEAKKMAWFQGANEPTLEGEVTTNDPSKMGYPKEMGYNKKPMETTAPGGQDSRPAEQKAFEGAADETQKVMGPKGEEFKEKVKMQRIPEGEKEANASVKWLEYFKKSGSKDGVKSIQKIAWKKAIEKKVNKTALLTDLIQPSGGSQQSPTPSVEDGLFNSLMKQQLKDMYLVDFDTLPENIKEEISFLFREFENADSSEEHDSIVDGIKSLLSIAQKRAAWNKAIDKKANKRILARMNKKAYEEGGEELDLDWKYGGRGEWKALESTDREDPRIEYSIQARNGKPPYGNVFGIQASMKDMEGDGEFIPLPMARNLMEAKSQADAEIKKWKKSNRFIDFEDYILNKREDPADTDDPHGEFDLE